MERASRRGGRLPRALHARDDDGFTLVEVLAALFIFVALSAAAVSLIITALKTIHDNNERVLAANVARSQVEALRTIGAENIPIGLTTTAAAGVVTPPGYAVETSAEWVGFGQTTSSCLDASPGQAYVRVHVAVTSPTLDGPQKLDTIINPEAAPSDPGTAAVTILVVDQNNEPVSGVLVSGTDASHPENSAKFPLTTGVDGCLFVPGLTAPATLQVTIHRDGYVPSTPTGTADSAQLDPDNLSRMSFAYAPEAAVDFTGGAADYPLPAGTPVSWQVSETGAVLDTVALGPSVAHQWPATNGFTAFLGDCDDADPVALGGTRQSFTFTPGGTTQASVNVAPVEFVGLKKDVTVEAEHVGGGCTTGPYDLGAAKKGGALTAGLPFGLWRFTATDGTTSETVTLAAPMVPAASGQPTPVTQVEFTAWAGPFFCPADSDFPELELDHEYDPETDHDLCYFSVLP